MMILMPPAKKVANAAQFGETMQRLMKVPPPPSDTKVKRSREKTTAKPTKKI
jgi:hypothetical protein